MKGISWPTVFVTIVVYLVLMRVAPKLFAGHGSSAHTPVGWVAGN